MMFFVYSFEYFPEIIYAMEKVVLSSYRFSELM